MAFSTQAEIDARVAAQRAYKLAQGPSELDLCPTCLGRSKAECRDHGIAASNARQSEFYRRWNDRHGD
jgi:hypothetical protein